MREFESLRNYMVNLNKVTAPQIVGAFVFVWHVGKFVHDTETYVSRLQQFADRPSLAGAVNVLAAFEAVELDLR